MEATLKKCYFILSNQNLSFACVGEEKIIEEQRKRIKIITISNSNRSDKDFV